jgi:hypothetical protein
MNEHDELGTRLTQTLTERADAMAGSSLGLADVTGRARSIRRRRTAGAVVGVAAAVAVIVPGVSLATRGGSHLEPAPATPSLTHTEGDHQQPRPGVLDVSDLPAGDAPRLEYVTGGRVLHRLDGSTADVPTRYPVGSFVALADGTHLWLTSHHGTSYVEIQDASGTMHAPVRSGRDLAVDHSHSVAAWTRVDGQVMVQNAGATEPLEYGDPVPAGNDLRMGPVLGDHCGGAADACEVYVNVPAESGWQPWLVSANGTEPYRDGSYLVYSDGTESGLSIGLTKITDFGSCSRLLGGGEFAGFETCKHTLVSFSPDGQLILADPAYHDGIGSGEIGMYDLDGRPLWARHSTERAQSFYPEAQWEDDTHVLAPVFQDGTWSLVRFGADGSMEYAVASVPGKDVANPFELPIGGPTAHS